MKNHNPKQDDYFNSDPPYLDNHFMKHSTVYKEFLAERNEILKHKWLESEKEGSDIGFERALLDWIRKHRANWRKQRKRD